MPLLEDGFVEAFLSVFVEFVAASAASDGPWLHLGVSSMYYPQARLQTCSVRWDVKRKSQIQHVPEGFLQLSTVEVLLKIILHATTVQGLKNA